MRIIVQRAVLAAFLLISVSSFASAGMMLVSNYTLDGTLADSLGNGNDLTTVGAPTFDGVGGLDFALADGLQLDTTVTQGDYRIELDFSFSTTSSWRKLVDFQNRTIDEGLYVDPSSSLNFYSGLGSGASMTAGTNYTVSVQKLNGVVEVGLDGVQQFTFTNVGAVTSGPNRLSFFLDDFHTGDREKIAGNVSAIRIFSTASNSTVPEPTSLIILGALFAPLAIVRRRIA